MHSVIRRSSLLVLPLGLLCLVVYLSRDDDRTEPSAIIVTATDAVPAPAVIETDRHPTLRPQTDGTASVAPAITPGDQVRLEQRNGSPPGTFRYLIAAFRPLGDDQPDLRTGDEVVSINGVPASAYITVDDVLLDLEKPNARLALLRNGSPIAVVIPETGL